MQEHFLAFMSFFLAESPNMGLQKYLFFTFTFKTEVFSVSQQFHSRNEGGTAEAKEKASEILLSLFPPPWPENVGKYW